MSVIVATIVRNEADWYLKKAVETWCEFADRIVCIDDGSSDASGELVGVTAEDRGTFCAVRPLQIGLFGNSSLGRAELWELAMEYSVVGDYIFVLDADLIPASDPTPHFTKDVIRFRYFDLWSPTRYRDDVMWTAHFRPRPWAAKRTHSGPWEWPYKQAHSSHFPDNLNGKTTTVVPLECSLLHYGYAEPRGRERQHAKYSAKMDILPTSYQGMTNSILTDDPRTTELPFEPEWTLL